MVAFAVFLLRGGWREVSRDSGKRQGGGDERTDLLEVVAAAGLELGETSEEGSDRGGWGLADCLLNGNGRGDDLRSKAQQGGEGDDGELHFELLKERQARSWSGMRRTVLNECNFLSWRTF